MFVPWILSFLRDYIYCVYCRRFIVRSFDCQKYQILGGDVFWLEWLPVDSIYPVFDGTSPATMAMLSSLFN